jgi:phage terminase large subunit-like protein
VGGGVPPLGERHSGHPAPFRETHLTIAPEIRLQPFTLEHFETWSRRLILDNGEPWELEPFQRSFVEDVFGMGGETECWLIVPEGNGKTTLIAGLALYGLRFTPDALIPVAASSRDQARIMYRQAKGFLRRSDIDDKDCWFEAFDGYRRIDLRGPGRTKRGEVLGSIEVHAADAGTGDGIIPAPFAFLDELHRHRSLDLYETWRGKLDKRHAQIVTISTAGEAGGEFERARELVRQETPALVRDPGFTLCRSDRVLLHEFALEEGGDADDMAAVKRCNPLPSISEVSLGAKRSSPTMTAAHWGRFVCNVPMRSGTAAIQELEWHNAATAERIPQDVDVWVGLDVGWRHDTTAFAPLWWRDDEYRLLGPAAIVEPPGDGSSTHPDEVKRTFRELQARYAISTVVMDMNRAEDIAAWLSDEGLHVVDRAQTNKPQAEDYERFMGALRHGWLLHSGDEGLRRHALNAVARLLPDGGAKFGRTSESRTGNQAARVIDALVAAAMVHSVRSEPEPTYRTMGF